MPEEGCWHWHTLAAKCAKRIYAIRGLIQESAGFLMGGKQVYGFGLAMESASGAFGKGKWALARFATDDTETLYQYLSNRSFLLMGAKSWPIAEQLRH